MDPEQDWEQLISCRHEKAGIVILNRDVLHSKICCTESCAALIREAASELAHEGYKKLVTSPVEIRVPETLQFFESLGFRKRDETYLFEANFGEAAVSLSMVPPKGITVSTFHHIRLETLYEMIRKAFVEDPVGFSKTGLDEYVSDKDFLKSCSFFASTNGKAVSFVMARNRGSRVAYLAYLGTVPQWQRQGIGLLLLKTSLHAASKAGFREAIGDQVDPDNVAIIKLLEKAGFHRACSQWNMSLELRSDGR